MLIYGCLVLIGLCLVSGAWQTRRCRQEVENAVGMLSHCLEIGVKMGHVSLPVHTFCLHDRVQIRDVQNKPVLAILAEGGDLNTAWAMACKVVVAINSVKPCS